MSIMPFQVTHFYPNVWEVCTVEKRENEQLPATLSHSKSDMSMMSSQVTPFCFPLFREFAQ